MQREERKVKITLLEPMLGTVPTVKDLYTRFVGENNPNGLDEDEADMVPEERPGATGFYSDVDGVYILDYHVKGFLKEAGNVLKDQLGIKALRSKLDNYVFIAPRHIYLKETPDGVLERPLRAQTMQGPRVSLAKSDYVNAGTTFEVSIILLSHKEITWKVIEELLDYGQLKGLGQYRNGGYGRFKWEYVT